MYPKSNPFQSELSPVNAPNCMSPSEDDAILPQSSPASGKTYSHEGSVPSVVKNLPE